MNTELQTIAIGNLVPSPTNPRKHFDKESMAELIASVKEKGIIVPPLVRPMKNGSTGGLDTRFQIIAGDRRVRAAKEVGLEQVPCIVRELSDEEAFEIQVIENLQRANIHFVEESEGFNKLLAQGKLDVKSLADKLGKSPAYITQRLKLTELIPPAKKLALEDKMSFSHAFALCRLQPVQQKEAVAWVKRGDSIHSFLQEIDRNFCLELKNAAFPIDDADLVPKAGSCMTCPKRTGTNPLLFPDYAASKRDTCTDPDCFADKERAFVKIQVGIHKDAVLLTAGTNIKHGQKLHGLPPNEWALAGKQKCDNVKEGVVVEAFYWRNSSDQFRPGQVLMVCTKLQTCKVHNVYRSSSYSFGSGRGKMTPEEKKKRAAAKRAVEIDNMMFHRAVTAVRKDPAIVKTNDLRRIVLELVDDFQFRYRGAAMATAFGLSVEGKTPSQKGSDGREKLLKFMKSADDGDLMSFLATLPVAPAYHSRGNDKILRDAAKGFGVKIADVEKEVDAPKVSKSKSE